MFIKTNIKLTSKTGNHIRVASFALILALISVPLLMTDVRADANHTGTKISCGHDSICRDIEGQGFDLILYSSLGSEMVVLYSENTVGNIRPTSPESYYSRVKGTVKDAIYYLSRHVDYSGFKFKKARKKTGFFRSKVIEGTYVVIPEYRSDSSNRPPDYSFSDKDGTLRVRMRPVIIDSGNE